MRKKMSDAQMTNESSVKEVYWRLAERDMQSVSHGYNHSIRHLWIQKQRPATVRVFAEVCARTGITSCCDGHRRHRLPSHRLRCDHRGEDELP